MMSLVIWGGMLTEVGHLWVMRTVSNLWWEIKKLMVKMKNFQRNFFVNPEGEKFTNFL